MGTCSNHLCLSVLLTVISLIVFICTVTYEIKNNDDDDDDDDHERRQGGQRQRATYSLLSTKPPASSLSPVVMVGDDI